MSTTTLKHQLIFYFICGAISTSCDFVLYYVMYSSGVQMDFAKGSSFLVATFISYFLNKHITFKTNHKMTKEFISFVVLHAITMGIDVLCNRIFVTLLSLFITSNIKITLAFIFATGCGVVANFIGQRFWVFRKQ